MESFDPEQTGKEIKGGVLEIKNRRRGVVKAPGAQHDDWIAIRSRRDWKWSKEQKHKKCLGQKGQVRKRQ